MKANGWQWMTLVFCTIASIAHAGGSQILSNLRVTPNPAAAGQAVTLEATARCARGPTESIIDVEQQVVTVRLVFVDCPSPPTPVPFALAIGTFAPGAYTLRFIAIAGEFDPPLQYPPIDLPFVIQGVRPAIALPANDGSALEGLSALLALVALAALRRTSARQP
ncbi:MAG: hypothetical protein ABIR62_10710 [Dokdonella sp.]|uniref:hypothetical protein n=1 Tax=Dokdonella sp. TaxID=2291710 RepID=UPI0032643FC6